MSAAREPSARLGDVQIYAKDAATLRPGCWLGDAAIAYVFENLSRRVAAANASEEKVLLLEPSITFTAAMVGEAGPLREMLSVPHGGGSVSLAQQLAVADLVLFPLNNNDDASASEGGGHWSLLAFRRRSEGRGACFEHYDSCGGANAPIAKVVTKAFAPLLLGQTSAKVQLVSMGESTPQQANGFDCGVYVLAMAEILCLPPSGETAPAPSESVTSALRGLTPAAITEKRLAWHEYLTSAVAENART